MKREVHPEAYDYYLNERGFTKEDVENLDETLIIGGWEMAQENYMVESTDEAFEEALVRESKESANRK